MPPTTQLRLAPSGDHHLSSSNIRTPTPSDGVAKRLTAFDSLFGATAELLNVFQHTTGVFERLLDFYCHCGVRTGVAKRVLAFDSLCGARTGVAKRVAVNELATPLFPN